MATRILCTVSDFQYSCGSEPPTNSSYPSLRKLKTPAADSISVKHVVEDWHYILYGILNFGSGWGKYEEQTVFLLKAWIEQISTKHLGVDVSAIF
jgi:hypothetical protein